MYANIKIFRLTSDLHYQTNINSPVDRHIDMLCVIEAIQKKSLTSTKSLLVLPKRAAAGVS